MVKENKIAFVPVQDFFEKFLKGDDLPPEVVLREGQDVATKISDPEVTKRIHMYPILCAAFERVLAGTNHVIRDTAASDPGAPEPNLTMYSQDRGAQAWNSSQPADTKLAPERLPYRGPVAWFFAVMFMDVRYSKKRDPFVGSETNKTERGRATLSQMAEIAAEALNLQHRSFLFTAIVVKTKARLLRWDRAGVVVSDEFDIDVGPGWLFNFVYRVATSGREAQGFDPTVADADEGQVSQLDDFIARQDNEYARGYLEEMNIDRILYPIQQLQCDMFEFAKTKIDDPKDPQYSALRGKQHVTLLIGHIRFAHSSLEGRGTKGFVAFVVDVDRLVFLKESWRPISTSRPVRAEGDIYCDLTEAGIPYIPFAIAGGDVSESHVTLNDEFLSASQRQQYRLVLWEVRIPLDRHANSYALIQVLHQALKAHRFAWEKAGILHRDISPGNVLIDMLSPPYAPMGLLCDWELSKKKTDMTEGATQHARPGTWITLSAVSLQYPYKPIEISDDLESFYHLLTYNILRFYRHSMTRSTTTRPLFWLQDESELAKHVWNYYDAVIRGNGGHPDRGGTIKWMAFQSVEPPFRLLDAESPLNRLLEDVHKLCFKHYRTVHRKDLDKYSGFSTDISHAPSTAAEDTFVPHVAEPDEYDIDDVASKPSEAPPTTSATTTEVKEDHAPPDSPLTNHTDMYYAFLSILHYTSTWKLHDKIGDQFEDLPTYIAVPDLRSSASQTKSAPSSSSCRSRNHDSSGEEDSGEW